MGEESQGKYFEEFDIGNSYLTSSRTVTETDVVMFAGLSGDFNPLHTDEEFAKKTPFSGRIAHGMLVASIATGLANQSGIFEGTTLALIGMTLTFKGPVKFGDTIHLVLKVSQKKETSKPDRGVVTFDTQVRNQRSEVLIEGQWTLMMRRKKV